MIMKNKQIYTENLKYSYIGDEQKISFALNGIDIEIKKGEFVAILGHNGSGKSTLAKLFNALYSPTDGDVYINNINTKEEEKLWDIRKSCGMVFQNPDNQLVATLVEEDVAFGPENLGIPAEEIRKRVDNALKTVGLKGFENKAPHMLSGGQKQRVAIAGILAMLPDIIVFDEPTAMLDPHGRKEVLNTIERLNKKQGKTIVYITHYIEETVHADKIIVLDHGKVITSGPPKEVFSKYELLKKAGLSVPRATRLYFMLKENGINIKQPTITNEDLVNELCQLL
jgi:energy-coupling factor transport system ATP-binding protein